METAPIPSFFAPAFRSERSRRPLPDLGAWVQAVPYVHLLFDERPEGTCLLAFGAQEVWSETEVTADLPERVADFVRDRWVFGWLGYDLKNAVEQLGSRSAVACAPPSRGRRRAQRAGSPPQPPESL